MEKITYSGSQKRIEHFLLSIYTFYSVTLLLISGKQHWEEYNNYIWVFCLVLSWAACIQKYKTYKYRMRFSAILMQITIILYAMKGNEFQDTIPTFMVFVVLLSLPGLPDIILYTVASALIIFFYHLCIVQTTPLSAMDDLSIMVSQLMNVFLLQYVVYTWVKRTNEGNNHLLKVIDELQVLQNSKDDFVANVSHEIRTPINTICGMSELILQEELPYKIKENVQNIQMAGRNLMGVVSDILDFSELQSGQMELEEEAYNITSTINDVVNMTMAWKGEKKLELIVDCDANIPCTLLGDEKKLRRVIMNLVDNAIKFTDEGCVCIGIGYREESYGINLVISVKDTGIGMDAVSLERIFTGFNQVDASTKRQEGGLGLGLAISHALVKKMGGAITIKSKLGKGTTAKVVVPQKILREEPMVVIQEKENISVAAYIDMEQFERVEIRDEYNAMIAHMMELIKGKRQICRNLAELQRQESKERFSHIFISIVEYKEDQIYFDELAKKTRVIVILDRYEENYITNQDILKVFKPFYMLTAVSVLNGWYEGMDGKNGTANRKFVTRDTHVLVVDDNRMNLRVIEELLANYRIKVTMAASGKEALKKIVSANYDFVFMDHMMPEMDGVETLHLIRSMIGTYYQKVPIVALTANAVAGTREALLKEGFSDFLEKPVERSVLERVIKRNILESKIIYGEDKQEESLKDDGVPVIDGLDVEQGILYCNGKEQYIKILQGYCEEWKQSGMAAQELFDKQDWKNYTIMVHGLKSAMRSIGAKEISEIAKKLEFAGKEGRIEYILMHHEELMEEYRKLFMKLIQNEIICPNKETENESSENISDMPVLEEADFVRILDEMEEASYSLNGERMLEFLDELDKYQYGGKALHKELAPMRRKVEMSDYVSAVEGIVRWKNGLAK